MRNPAFAGVDWGTTRFRLWLMDADGGVLGERRSDEGLEAGGRIGFGAVLDAHLAALEAPADLPVVICGMAGSRQGWVEAPYVDLPAPIEAIAGNAVTIPDTGRRAAILPGLAQRLEDRPDVIRGEETQLLGAIGKSQQAADGLVCMPGTHSKWVRVSTGTIAGFSTFMTGELFALLSAHSILVHSVAGGGNVAPDDPAFLAAVSEAAANPALLTSRLFSVRAGSLLLGQTSTAAKARLSGLLIGAEIAAGSGADPARPVVLVASGAMGALYAAAFAETGIPVEIVDADDCVRAGLRRAAAQLFPNA